MTSRDFCYWLQGFFEVATAGGGDHVLNAAQIEVIRRHLSLVFAHEIDSSMGDAAKQEELNKIHGNSSDPKNVVYRC